MRRSYQLCILVSQSPYDSHTLLWVKFPIFKKAREIKSWGDTNHFLAEMWPDNWSCPAVQSVCGPSRGMPGSDGDAALVWHRPLQHCGHVHSAQHCSWLHPGSIWDLQLRDMSLCNFSTSADLREWNGCLAEPCRMTWQHKARSVPGPAPRVWGMKMSITIKYRSGQGKPNLPSPCFCYLTKADCPISCVWLPRVQPWGEVTSLGGATFWKAKEGCQTEGRVPRQALVLSASGLGDQTLHERTVTSIAIPICYDH